MGKPEAVTYSGPTYVAIRSVEHATSSAVTHSEDLEKVLTNLPTFEPFTKTKNGLE